MGRICRKKGFKSGMKERVGDEKLIILTKEEHALDSSAGRRRGTVYIRAR